MGQIKNLGRKCIFLLLFSARDHEFTQTMANRIIDLTPKGIIDKLMTYDEYLEDSGARLRAGEIVFVKKRLPKQPFVAPIGIEPIFKV